MDYRIDWSPEAIEDLESIAEYISRDSEYYAKAVVRKIVNLTRGLNKFPLIGRVVPELKNKNIREQFVYSYRVIYKIEKYRILIVAVIHGKRLLEPLSDRLS